ncbi:hypothetical protein C462_10752 [Halorubrum distributum JCM 13916]|uniref:Uncharacterized protein n=2 Tax=Halorubrum distributum TaxID=29283 RepID=M0PN93_9EURY|nr:hypothetical protein C462_10752 [Halorubrum arcis JCM 13916]
MQAMRELLEEHDHDDLIELRSELNSQIEEWRAEYDVDSVDEIQKDPVEGPDAREWRLVAYRHSIVEEAIEWVEGRSQ